MCSFVRVVNMSHSTLKMAEGHGGLVEESVKKTGRYRGKKIRGRTAKCTRQIKSCMMEEERERGRSGGNKRAGRGKKEGKKKRSGD